MLKLVLSRPSWAFCSKRYQQFVSQHIVNIVDSKPQYHQCINDFNKIIKHNQQKPENAIKSQMNLIFNVHSLPVVLDKYKGQLRSMVLNSQILHQSELDKLTTWLSKSIKFNNNVQISQYVSFVQQQEKQKNLMETEIKQIMEKQQLVQVAQLSKKMRNKYLSLDSRYIYQKCVQVGKKLSQKGITGKEKVSNQFWDKLNNIKPRLLQEECNSPEKTKQHLQITKGKLRFRFPPEPNGYLHIGHVKAMRINFQTAKRVGGTCYLRYDDTNPETQSHQYIDNILSNIRWLGYEPDKITYASDYFPEMMEFAIKLIKEGHAYVCDSTQEQIQAQRKQKRANQFRNREIEESLKFFPDLREGQTLRLKLDADAKNPTLRDPIIYRRKKKSHPRSGDKYEVYPIYDFAHCIGDSLEHIDYSLCSLEFEVRRQLYYKILHLLNLYKPSVWQYSRLNIQGSVISKRKIKNLLDNGVIDGWSDPRLLTIGGLINRGYTPSMLFRFIDRINASRTGNQNIVQYSLLQRQMKKELQQKSDKSMMVLNPLQLTITNFKELPATQFTINAIKVNISPHLFIQKNQNLEPHQIVVLKYIGVFEVLPSPKGAQILCKKIDKSVQQIKQQKQQFKVLHWISQTDSVQIPTITFAKLLDQKGEPLPQSKKVFPNALVHKDIAKEKENLEKYWQMERLGFFKFSNQGNFMRCVAL